MSDDLFFEHEEKVKNTKEWLQNVSLSFDPQHPNAPNIYYFMVGRLAQYGVFALGNPSTATFMDLSWRTYYKFVVKKQRANPMAVAQEILKTYPYGGINGIAHWIVSPADHETIEDIAKRMPRFNTTIL